MAAAPPYLAGCHSNESRAPYKVSPLPVRTVTTADTTAASSRLVTSRVRNFPSIVTVPTFGSSQRRWTFCAVIWASKQGTVVWAKVTRASGRRLKPVNRKRFTVKRYPGT